MFSEILLSEFISKGQNANGKIDYVKDHYKFVKWCSDSECTAEWNFDTAVTAATTLYALWKAEEYDVVFDVQGVGRLFSNRKK